MPLIGSEFLIPFLFVLALSFGALEASKVFKNRAVNAVIAVALALFAASYQPFVTNLWGLLPALTWFFLLVFLLAFVGRALKVSDERERTKTLVVGGMIMLLFLTVGISMMPQVPVIGTENLLMAIGIFFLVMLIWIAAPHGPVPAKGE